MDFYDKTALHNEEDKEINYKQEYFNLKEKHAKLLGRHHILLQILDFYIDKLGPQPRKKMLKALKLFRILRDKD